MLNRKEYQLRAREFAIRGEELPHAKLCIDDVLAIRNAKLMRDALRAEVINNLSNDALASKYGVHKRTIERVLSNETWVHV